MPMKPETALLLATVDYARAFERGNVARIDEALSRMQEIRAEHAAGDVPPPVMLSAQVIRLPEKKKPHRAVFVRRGRCLVRVAG